MLRQQKRAQFRKSSSVGPKLFWRRPNYLDRVYNVKFSSKKLFLVWTKTFWTWQNNLDLLKDKACKKDVSLCNQILFSKKSVSEIPT